MTERADNKRLTRAERKAAVQALVAADKASGVDRGTAIARQRQYEARHRERLKEENLHWIRVVSLRLARTAKERKRLDRQMGHKLKLDLPTFDKKTKTANRTYEVVGAQNVSALNDSELDAVLVRQSPYHGSLLDRETVFAVYVNGKATSWTVSRKD